MKGSDKLVVFDVCDTLYYSNTTFDFIEYHTKHQLIKRLLFKIYTSKISPLFILGVFYNKIFNCDIIKDFSIKLLEGDSKERLYSSAENFLDQVLKSKKILELHDVLKNSKEQSRVILLSASIDPVIFAISKKLEVPFFSSELEYDNNLCTGKLKVDLTGEKETKLSTKDFMQMTVYSDNLSDANLMLKAKSAYAIIHNSSQKQFWKQKNVNCIKV